MCQLSEQARSVLEELKEKAKLKPEDIVVVGCSTSEIIGSKIGSNSSPDVAKPYLKRYMHMPMKWASTLLFNVASI